LLKIGAFIGMLWGSFLFMEKKVSPEIVFPVKWLQIRFEDSRMVEPLLKKDGLN
jgi:hypothetical protein